MDNDDTPVEEFLPMWASPPGETLKEMVKILGLSDQEYAKDLNMSVEDLHKLYVGEIEITDDLAGRLLMGIGLFMGKRFWLRREEQYRRSLKRIAEVKDATTD